MPDANFEITDDNKREVLKTALTQALRLEEGESEPDEDYFTGMSTHNIWDEFRRLHVVRDVWQEQGNQNKVVKTFCYDPILTEPMEAGEVRGFYLGHDVNRDYDEDEDEWFIESEGPRVFFADGDVVYRGNDYDFWSIRNGQDFRDDEDVHPMETRVIVEGAKTRTNLFTGETQISVDDDVSKVQVRDHDAEIPEPGIRSAIERSLYIAGEHSDRGIIRGDTGDNPNVLAVLTIGSEDDVEFYEANEYNDEDTLRVVAQDKDGAKARMKLPIEKTNEDFGLDEEEAEREVYEKILKEQPIAVFGRLGISYTIALTDNDDVASPTPDGPGEVEAALNDVEEYEDAGWMTTYEDNDGNQLKGIDLTDHNLEDEHGNEVPNPVDIGPYEAYDVRQEVDPVTNEPVWMVEVLLSDEDSRPWMDVREHPWTRVKLENGRTVTVSAHVDEDEAEAILDEPVDEIDGSGTANDGAFVCFLNQSGEAFLPESDPFSGAFDDLPGFDEVDDGTEDADDSEDAEDAEQQAETPL